MKKGLKIFLIVFVCIGLIAGAVSYYLLHGMKKIMQADIGAADLSAIEDGGYTGSVKAGRWGNTVSVSVQGGAITGITVQQDMAVTDDELKAALFDQVITDQSLDVDVVSGATVTCKAYLLAMEDALRNAAR